MARGRGLLLRYCAMAQLRRPRLQRFFSSFPEGWPGLGLLILRLAVTLRILDGHFHRDAWTHPALTVAVIFLCMAIVIGLFTPLAGMIMAIVRLASCIVALLATDAQRTQHVCQSLETIMLCIGLALLGPGAYSFDARLFGPRKIVIPKGRRPPNQ